MRLLTGKICVFFLCLFVPYGSAGAQTEQSDWIALRDDLSLKVMPAKYETVAELKPESERYSEGWATIPATFETVTETIVVQEAYNELKVIPAIIAADGTIEQAAKAKLVPVAAVTQERSRRIIKTPSRLEKRRLPNLDGGYELRRQLVRPKIYILRDATGQEIARYDDPEKLVEYLHRK